LKGRKEKKWNEGSRDAKKEECWDAKKGMANGIGKKTTNEKGLKGPGE